VKTKFAIYWRNGDITVIEGLDLAGAFKDAGYGADNITQVAIVEDNFDATKEQPYRWDPTIKVWRSAYDARGKS